MKERASSLDRTNVSDLGQVLRFAICSRLDPDRIELGESRSAAAGSCSSVLIPFDYDDLTLVGLDPGRGFLERSAC